MGNSGADLERAKWLTTLGISGAGVGGADLERIVDRLLPVLYDPETNSIVGPASGATGGGGVNLSKLVGGSLVPLGGAQPSRQAGVAFNIVSSFVAPTGSLKVAGDFWFGPPA